LTKPSTSKDHEASTQSASKLKLAQRLKEKRLYQHLEESSILKTFTSQERKSELQSETSKYSVKIPGSHYRRVKKSRDWEKKMHTSRHTENDEYGLSSSRYGASAIIENDKGKNCVIL
jgi:hypothetical protein